jgi:amino acid adenylation domain-containing protein
MKSTISLLAQLKEKNIAISLDDSSENLRIRGTLKNLTAADKQLISENKQELISFLKDQQINVASIQSAPLQKSYPISDAQRRLWILSQFKDGSVAYNMPAQYHITNDIDVACFKRATEATIDRHEILRTVFKVEESGEIRQWILNREDLSFEIAYFDFRNEAAKEDKVADFIRNKSLEAFDLENGPLLRTALIQLDDQEYVFYFNMHHIISDGWSMNVLYNDLSSFYMAFSSGVEDDFAPLKIQYKDYANWQLNQLESEHNVHHRAYWLNKLSGDLGELDLANSNERPLVKTHKGRTVATYLDKELTAKFSKYSLLNEGTLFMSILSALSALMHKYSGLEDVIIGTPIAGRNLRELENQIGFYVNALALRTEIKEANSFNEIFQNVKQTTLDAFTHQQYPFDRLVEELNQNRQTSRSAIFDILLVLQNTGEKGTGAPVSIDQIDDIVEIKTGTCIYDIKFEFQEVGDYIKLLVEHNSDVFAPQMIADLIVDFKKLSNLLLAHEEDALNSLTYELNLEQKETSNPDNTLVQLFQKQVNAVGNKTALSYNENTCSYKQLNAQANQIAQFLHKNIALTTGNKVGLFLNEGNMPFAAMLAVLKAGGAYVVLDPDSSEEELLSIIDNLQVCAIITEKEFIERTNRLQWVSNSLKAYLCLDTDDVISEQEQQENIMMSQDLWDHVGRRAENHIASGGWLSSYTGKTISQQEMEEYSMNAFHKLKDGLHKEMRVLEIGCSSGITLSKIAPHVAYYLGTDLSPVILSGTQQMVEDTGLTNVKLKQLIAHEVSELEEEDFDLIIINSVIQNFHGHNYLLDVIRKCINRITDQGQIFVGDVMDINKKADMIAELEQFKIDNSDKGYTTKTDFSTDLFVSKGYFQDLVFVEDELASVQISEKISTIDNELTKFRFDALLQIDKIQTAEDKAASTSALKRVKNQFDRTQIESNLNENLDINIAPDQLAFVLSAKINGANNYVYVKHHEVFDWFNTKNKDFDFSANHKWGIHKTVDLSLLEIYGSLLFGNQLVLLPKIIQNDVPGLIEFIQQENITALQIDSKQLANFESVGITFNESAQPCALIVDGSVVNMNDVKETLSHHSAFSICNKQHLISAKFPTFKKVITPEEEEKIHSVFNNTAVDYPKNISLLDLFEEKVKNNPNQVALTFNGIDLTYQELEERSNQLANYLQQNHNILTEDLVGVKQDRSEWLLPSILGVLKAGAAYVPIDPNYPQERVDFIKNDTNFKICLDSTELNNFIAIREDFSTSKPPNTIIQQNNLAYVIYTSGSTGRPKGVLVEHGSILNRLLWMKEDFSIVEDDIFLQKTPITFDVSVWELFLPIITGSKLVFAIPDGHKDPAYIENAMEVHKVSIIHFVPSLLRDALENIVWNKLTNLRHVVCSGEALTKKLETTFAQKVPASKLHNYYGPTEAAIDVTKINLTENPTIGNEVSIGKPVSNTVIHIVNEEGEFQAIGEPGELLIGGIQVARGYLNQPELSAEKFIQNPFDTNQRMYRTGDLAKWMPDGNIEFIGRRDDQVKIRGFRIELGEIEYALSKIPAIDAAVVVTKQNSNNEKELVVYIAAKEALNVNDLRMELKEFIPDYMVPSIFVQLDNIPLTAHGKVDKKMLPDPAGFGMASGAEYVAPRNEIETKLVSIWEEVLERENIGVKDDFFALGGHSIKAVRLRNEYSKKLEVKLSLEDLFSHKTIESQRKLIQPAIKEVFVAIPKIAVEPSGGYPISDAQRRLWVLSQFDEGSVAYNMPTTIHLKGDYDIACFKKAVYAVLDRHEILRTVFKTDAAGQIKQWVLNKEELGFEIDFKDFKNQKETVNSYISEDSYKPFDLKNGPLLRAALLQIADNEFVFYYNLHHIITDGWSNSVLSKDVLKYYNAFKTNTKFDLAPLKIQYKDYASWQLEQVENSNANEHLNYWKEQLKGELPLLNLPATKQRPRIKTNSGHGLKAYFDVTTTKKLKKYAEDNGGSLFMGLLSTWNVLLYRYTNQNDIIIGSSIAGREHADLDNQIGFYSNTIVSRNAIELTDNFDSFFKTVKERALMNYAHQSYPFIRLVEEMNLKVDTGRNAIFDVMMFLQNNGTKIEEHQLSDDEIAAITDAGPCPSKFDLNVGVQELGEIISFNFVYNPDVYEREMIESLIEHYKQLVNAVLDNTQENLSKIDFLNANEKNELLHVFNPATKANFEHLHTLLGQNKSVLDLFEEQALKTPERTAVSFGDNSLTYQDLNERSNQLANFLLANHKIAPDDLVGLMLNRSEWLVVAILGILKTGAAYLPIDPEDSHSRKEHIITDSQSKVLLTEIDFIHDVDYYEGEIVAIDIEFEPEEHSSDKPSIKVKPANLAYVIYTSGSTGKPKGVLNTLMALTDYTLGVIEKTNIEDCQTFGHVSTIAADLGNTVLFPALVVGGELRIIAKEDIINTVRLQEFNLDCVKMTPSHWKALQTKEHFFTPNKCLILGGETFSSEILNYFKVQEPNCQIFNHYGPTETTVGKLILKVDVRKNYAEIPLGQAIGLNKVHVLNSNLQHCPIGVTGEICISGMGLAKGYLNQEDQTNLKFVNNPFNPDEKMYKTGDLGKWLNSGEIAFVGREDDQVKIRGYRIELGEVEEALLKLDEISNAAVKVWKHENDAEIDRHVVTEEGENKLVAYIVSKTEQNTAKLRSGLRKILPEFMLPSSYVQLDFLPLTSNGKVDKGYLPNPKGLAVLSGTEYIAPRNEIEVSIIEIISYIVGKPENQISVYDNFFDLGISSLGLMKLYNSINSKLNVNLQVVSVFEFSNVSALASYVAKGAKQETEEIIIEDVSNDVDEIMDLM